VHNCIDIFDREPDASLPAYCSMCALIALLDSILAFLLGELWSPGLDTIVSKTLVLGSDYSSVIPRLDISRHVQPAVEANPKLIGKLSAHTPIIAELEDSLPTIRIRPALSMCKCVHCRHYQGGRCPGEHALFFE
jgi:hypothetical protein